MRLKNLQGTKTGLLGQAAATAAAASCCMLVLYAVNNPARLGLHSLTGRRLSAAAAVTVLTGLLLALQMPLDGMCKAGVQRRALESLHNCVKQHAEAAVQACWSLQSKLDGIRLKFGLCLLNGQASMYRAKSLQPARVVCAPAQS